MTLLTRRRSRSGDEHRDASRVDEAAAIDVRHLSAGYGDAPVVRDLDLQVRAGEVVALLGANGAGKTTTLLTVAGLLPPLAGEVLVLGEPVRAGRAHLLARRGVSLVPDDRSIFVRLTVRENLQLGVRATHNQGMDRALELFPELRPLLGRRAGMLSGGQQQMLALGRALAGRPRVLMVDEMSLGLAPIVVERLLRVLRRIADDDGVAVLFVEQHVHLALETADRVYVLDHGDLALAGDPTKMIEKDLARLENSYLGDVR